MAKERIGILGGTFDPIHNGHIAMAKAALESAGVDRVLVLPTGNPPHKSHITPAEDRWRMLCAALANEEKILPDRMELEREGVIYTYDTLLALRKRFPKAELCYIIGADTLLELKNWHRYEEVLKLCTFLVCPRPWDAQPAELLAERKRLEAMGGSFLHLMMDPVDVSSTEIRSALQRGETPAALPTVCAAYAQIAGLYGLPERWPDARAWLAKLFDMLPVHRFAHSLGVAQTCRRLALLHQEDPLIAEQAGLLHDCGKNLPLKQQQRIIKACGIPADEGMLNSTALMHGPVGAYLAREEFGVTDERIADAICKHTTGAPEMSTLDMIVYIADKIEPNRRDYPVLTRVRMLANLDLKRAMLLSLESTREYVTKSNKPLHPASLATINRLKSELTNKKK